MAGRPGRRSRPLAIALAVGLTTVLASGALAGPAPDPPPPAPAPAALPAGSVETPGRNELVSTPQADGGALSASPASAVDDLFAAPTISASGRYVVFLEQPDPKQGNRVLLRDRSRKTTTLIAAPDSNGPLQHPTISGDGRWIAYTRSIDGPNPTEVILVDRTTRERVGLPPLPTPYFFPDQPALSRDGRYLVVRARASQGTEILLLDRSEGRWRPVSVDVNNRPTGGGNARAAQPAISGDGLWVAFTATSAEARLVAAPTATNDFRQVYLRDLASGTTRLVSVTPGEQPGNNHSLNPAVNANGRVVAYPSAASDLVGGDANQQVDVFAWTAATGGSELVSRASDGTAGNGPSGYPAVTADGGSIAFASGATTLVPGDTTAGVGGVPGATFSAVRTLLIAGDIFVRDRAASRTTRVSAGRDNASEANGASTYPSVSSTGRYVAFTSVATNLVAKDANKGAPDVFVRDRPPRISAAPDPLDFGSAPIGSLGTTRSATVRSTGITPARIGDITIGGTHTSDFFVAVNECQGKTLAPGATCTVQVVFIGTAKGNRRATLQVASDAGAAVAIRLVGAVGVPKLKVEPAQGPSGIVVVATGTGFPPNAPVALTWSAGITATPLSPVVSDATGSFVAQVLVLPRDRLGRRNLRALASVPGLTIEPVLAPFRVVASTAGPPTSGLVQVFAGSPGEPIILRR